MKKVSAKSKAKPQARKYQVGGMVRPDVTTMGGGRGNAGGAQRGLARAAAMSGRTMPTAGRPAAMPAQAQAGMARRPVGYKKGGKVGARKK